MKRTAMLITLVCVFAVLVAVYVLFLPKDTGDIDTEETSGVIMVNESDYTEVSRIVYTYNGETVSLEIDGGKWYLSGDREFPVNQEIAVQMSWAISDIGAMRKISDEIDNLADYGFDKPEFEINVTYIGGAEKVYYIGSLNTYNDSRYLYDKTADEIYNISSALTPYFEFGLYDIINSDTLPEIDITTITSIDYSVGGEVKSITNAEVIELFMSNLAFNRCIDYNVDQRKAAVYGIDEESDYFTINYVEIKDVSGENNNISSTANIKLEKSHTVIFGDTVSSEHEDAEAIAGTLYAMPKDSTFVYTIDGSFKEFLIAQQ